VLSHAAKRKQKKAASLKEAVPEKSSTKKQKKEEGDSHSIKRQNSVWVGNLCYKTTPESLRRFFDGVGEITRVYLPTKLANASPGESARRENRGCVSDLLLNRSLPVVLFFFFCSNALTDKVRLCGLCDARGEASRRRDVRVAIGRTPPFNQGWCVASFETFFVFTHAVCVAKIF
jgi:hypothetical protein